MVYVTGDCHGEFQRFSTKNFPEQRTMTREDLVIVCGDFGGVWADGPEERYWLRWLAEKPFTLLFADGNHENFDRLRTYPEMQWHGGRVRVLQPGLLQLLRGQVYELERARVFVMGGASSHDAPDGILDPAAEDFQTQARRLRKRHARFRVLHQSWWPEELPSAEEYREARQNLERCGWTVDYVITHCASTEVTAQIDSSYAPDELTEFFSEVDRRLTYRTWFFGHYHREQTVDAHHVALYESLVRVL